MLFTWCNRSSDNSFSQVPFEYQTSKLNTISGFGRKPALCPGVNVPYVTNRGVPKSLFNQEMQLKGQDSMFQPVCASATQEKTIQFSMMDYYNDIPVGKAAVCGPVPITQVQTSCGGCNGPSTDMRAVMCAHFPVNYVCNDSCRCPPNCVCKQMQTGRNLGKLQMPTLPVVMSPNCQLRK